MCVCVCVCAPAQCLACYTAAVHGDGCKHAMRFVPSLVSAVWAHPLTGPAVAVAACTLPPPLAPLPPCPATCSEFTAEHKGQIIAGAVAPSIFSEESVTLAVTGGSGEAAAAVGVADLHSPATPPRRPLAATWAKLAVRLLPATSVREHIVCISRWVRVRSRCWRNNATSSHQKALFCQ